MGRVLPRIFSSGLAVFSLGVSVGLWAGSLGPVDLSFFCSFWWFFPVFFPIFWFVWHNFCISLGLSLVLCVSPEPGFLSGTGGDEGFCLDTNTIH